MGDLKRQNHQRDINALGNVTLNAAGLAIGTDTTKPQTANALVHTIGGEFMSDLAAADPLVTLSGEDIPDGSKALWLFTVDAAGTVREYQSDVKLLAEAVYWPSMPNGETAIGGIKVEADGASFTANTTDLDAANITTTYHDFMHVPASAE